MRKKLFDRITFILMLSSLLLLPAACEKEDEMYTIRYEVTGNAAFATYYSVDGQHHQTGITTPWTFSFQTSDKNQTISLSAGSAGSDVMVVIYLNGNVVLFDTATNGLTASTGSYNISYFL